MTTFIISLGGSLINPGEINKDFLKEFKAWLLKNKEHQFFIICGGGKLTRQLQQAGEEISNLSKEELDWLGIHATRLHAQLVKDILKEESYEQIVINPTQKIKTNKSFIIAAGYKPGWSTDYVATLIAQTQGSKHIINLSNIDYVYDKDPRKNKDAQPIKQMSWDAFRTMVGDTWTPGMSAPFDPIASKLAQEEHMQVVIANGKDLKNLQKIIDNKEFIGTLIE